MTRLKVIIYGMALAMSFSSCVREDLDQCPPLRINIEVKDKNYFNVDQTAPEEKRDENQPFRSFVPSLFYRLSRLNDDGTQQVIVEEKSFGVEGDGFTYPVSFDPDISLFAKPKGNLLSVHRSICADNAFLDEKDVLLHLTSFQHLESFGI